MPASSSSFPEVIPENTTQPIASQGPKALGAVYSCRLQPTIPTTKATAINNTFTLFM